MELILAGWIDHQVIVTFKDTRAQDIGANSVFTLENVDKHGILLSQNDKAIYCTWQYIYIVALGEPN